MITRSILFIVCYAVACKFNIANSRLSSHVPRKWESDILELVTHYNKAHLSIYKTTYFESPRLTQRIKTSDDKIDLYIDFPKLASKCQAERAAIYEKEVVKSKTFEEYYKYEDYMFRINRSKNNEIVSLTLMKNYGGSQSILGNYGVIFGVPHSSYANPLMINDIIKDNKYSIISKDKDKEIIVNYENEYGNYNYYIYYDDNFDKYLLSKIVFTKNRHHWYEPNKPLYTIPVDPRDYMRIKSTMESTQEIIEYDQYKKISNRIIFTHIKHKDIEYFSNGQKVLYDSVWKITPIAFDFSADKLNLPSEIKNGTPVTIFTFEQESRSFKDPEEGIEYEWRDGQVVKKIPQGALAKLPNILELHGGNLISRGLIIILICLILTLATAALLYYRHRNKPQGN